MPVLEGSLLKTMPSGQNESFETMMISLSIDATAKRVPVKDQLPPLNRLVVFGTVALLESSFRKMETFRPAQSSAPPQVKMELGWSVLA